MKKTQLVMVLHGHQPVGNLASVMDTAHQRCYEPVLAAIERHPGIHLGLHLSGCLLEWLEDEQSAWFDRLTALVKAGRIELLGGGMYEPILTAIPPADAAAQIELMSAWIEDRFGEKPRGLWLAERVWEPSLIGLLTGSGLNYTLLDDTAFLRAGLSRQQLGGHLLTEQAGEVLSLLPIDSGLRASMPFQAVDRTMERLVALAETTGGVLTYADDLEKFGLWPGTRDKVSEDGWLDQLFAAFEQASDWLRVTGPASLLDTSLPKARVYPAGGAYDDLQLWALPTAAIKRHQEFARALAAAELDPGPLGMGPASTWQGFLAKYPEANHLHKKMLLVSRKLAEALEDDGDWEEIHEEARYGLFRGQCACSYWHGRFGGLYHPHLRSATYTELIRAERILDQRSQGDEDWVAYDQIDFDADGREEVIFEQRHMNLYVDPARGGMLTELDHRLAAVNLVNVLTRRIEPALSKDHGSAENKDADAALAQRQVEDRGRRGCFMDRFPAPGTALEELQRASYTEEGDFLGMPYQVEQLGIDEQGDFDFNLVMTRTGNLIRAGRSQALKVEKRFKASSDEASFRVEYHLSNPNDSAIDLLFCPELNLSLPASDAAKQACEFEGVLGSGPRARSAGEVAEAAWFALVDQGSRLRVELRFDPVADIWRYPIETISRSERGLETNYQGLAIVPRWELTVPARSSCRVCIRLTVEHFDDDAVVPIALDEDTAAG